VQRVNAAGQGYRGPNWGGSFTGESGPEYGDEIIGSFSKRGGLQSHHQKNLGKRGANMVVGEVECFWRGKKKAGGWKEAVPSGAGIAAGKRGRSRRCEGATLPNGETRGRDIRAKNVRSSEGQRD